MTLSSCGLSIVSTKILLCPEFLLKALYPSITEELWLLTLKYMTNGQSEMGLVEGEAAIQQMLIISGAFTEPSLCDPSSIRGRYGIREPERIGTAVYYRNAFHRSYDQAEANRDINLYAKL